MQGFLEKLQYKIIIPSALPEAILGQRKSIVQYKTKRLWLR